MSVFRGVFNPHEVGFYGDAAFAFYVHSVKDLLLHIPCGDRACGLDETVGKGGFAVVYVRDDGEVADVFGVSHGGVMGDLVRGVKGFSY